MRSKGTRDWESVVTNPRNSTIKLARALHMKKYRELYGMYFIEGIKMVKEALREHVSIEKLIFSEDFSLSELGGEQCIDGIDYIYAASGLFKQISDVESPQGVIAIVRKRSMALQLLLGKPSYFIVILDRVQDPGNVGSIIRTVDAAGGNAVILLKGSADPYNPKTLRSTMGSVFRVPVFEIEEREGFMRELVSVGAHLIVSCLEGDNLFRWNGIYSKTALVIGNESKGVGKDIQDIASGRITIPIAGGAESLNASVAAGILIYEMMAKAGNLGQEDY